MSSFSTSNCRVLSIQSHVVSGYVGNKSATFPLQEIEGLKSDISRLRALESMERDNDQAHAEFVENSGEKEGCCCVMTLARPKYIIDLANCTKLACPLVSLGIMNVSTTYRRVLAIQSYVVSGYVGNKSCTFPLQILGFDVDAINSVQFSNHTGYGVFKGQVLNAEQLGELYDGLRENQINKYSHLLTGYIGCRSFLEKVKDVIIDLKKENPNLIYVCDPVMGDEGEMYVPEDLLPVYKENIVALADIITPNQFEAELLTGMKMTDIDSARRVIHKLQDMGAGTVVISSSDLGPDGYLMGLGCQKGSKTILRIDMPLLPARFIGTGDLFTALLLAWLHSHPDDLKLALEKIVSTMQQVLIKTLNRAQEMAGPGNNPNMAQRELMLIQSKGEIEHPKPSIKAVLL